MTDGVALGMAGSVRAALDRLDLDDRDQAAAELALTYGRDIDMGGDLAKVGPPLLACLTALLLTPAARLAAMKGVPNANRPASPLDELRARRKRKSGAADLDTAAAGTDA